MSQAAFLDHVIRAQAAIRPDLIEVRAILLGKDRPLRRHPARENIDLCLASDEEEGAE